MEVWKPVRKYPGYEVSSYGRIKSFRQDPEGRVIKDNRNTSGHFQIKVYPGRKMVMVHVLVLEAFLGPRPDGMEAMHLDGDPRNNHVSNLIWGTHLENMRDWSESKQRRLASLLARIK